MTYPIPKHRRRNPIGLFEENYRLLCALLPDLLEGEEAVSLRADAGPSELQVRVLERSPYTRLLSLRMPFVSAGVALPELSMQLRMYHDARVAEVIAYQGCGRIPAPYQVKPRSPWLNDEKRQINLLLHELLRYCQRHAYRVTLAQDTQ
ncbi:MAG: DUF1249 domain-containing protein [Thiohalomonadaceae bacterium]